MAGRGASSEVLLGLSGPGEVDENRDSVCLGDHHVLDGVLLLEFFVEGLLDNLSDIAQLGIDLFKSFFQSRDSHLLEIRRTSLYRTLTSISSPSFQPSGIHDSLRYGDDESVADSPEFHRPRDILRATYSGANPPWGTGIPSLALAYPWASSTYSGAISIGRRLALGRPHAFILPPLENKPRMSGPCCSQYSGKKRHP